MASITNSIDVKDNTHHHVCNNNSVHSIITSNKLDISEYYNMVVDSSCGAISSFIGTTRDNFDGKEVVQLEYEAYIPMALEEMKKIGLSVMKKWPDIFKIVFAHRIGIVPVLEGSIAIYISSPHRKASLDAVQYSIDELKARVPIWKKEIYNDNESDNMWKKNPVQKRNDIIKE